MSNTTAETTDTTATTATTAVEVKQTAFKVGWSYSVFLTKNGFAPSEHRQEEWLTLSREASKTQMESMRSLAMAGAKTTCKVTAVYSAKDGRFNTAMTARVVKPGCDDAELITEALLKAQRSATKRLSDMRFVAARQGIVVS